MDLPVTSAFSWAQFAWIVLVFVGVPAAFFSLVLWRRFSPTERRTDTGRLGLWGTGLLAVAFGFVSCAAWLTWSADYRGGVRGPGLPAPTEFPAWQIAGCGATVVLLCFLAARMSRWAETGGYVAALGTTVGFATAFCVVASTDVTGQSGVGVLLCVLGWGVGLTVVMWCRDATVNGKWHKIADGL